MKIAAWNVNSINVRQGHLLQWLARAEPDVVLLQELKGQAEAFPHLEVQAMGYDAAVLGQKAYNGVAVLSRIPITAQRPGLPGFDDDQARYIEADLANGWTVASVYIPNGMDLAASKFTYKMAFYAALSQYLGQVRGRETPFVLGGDFNAAYHDNDVHDPVKFRDRLLYSPQERAALRGLLHQGYTDTFRILHPNDRLFSWWDYREGRFDRDEGVRIDYLLASPHAATRLTASGIDPTPRGWEKPSDHTPVWATFMARATG